MRKLAIFSFSFAVAAAAYVWLLPETAALILCGALILAGILLLLRRTDAARRIQIAAFGAAFALLWAWGYERLKIAPMRSLCGEDVSFTGEVIAAPEQAAFGGRVQLRVNGGNVLLYFYSEIPALRYGDRVRATAEVVDVSDGGEEDNFYFQARDISLLAFADSVEVEAAERIPLSAYPRLAADKLRGTIAAVFPADAEGFMRALLTGDRSGLSYALRNEMSVTGISHVVAVSGMHISLLAGVVMTLCLRRRRMAAGASIAVMLFFAAMLGFTPSVTRAVIMNTILLLAPLLKRENDAPTALGFALLVILLFNPWSVASLSLQLSFGAMAGIFLLAPRLYKFFSARTHLDAIKNAVLHWIIRFACVSLSTTLGSMAFTAPLIATSFGTVSLISPLANLLCMSLLSLLFAVGFVTSVVGMFLPGLCMGMGWLLAFLVRLVLWLINLLAGVPYAAIYTNSVYIRIWLVTAYLMVGAFLLIRKKRKPLLLVGCLGLSLFTAILLSGARTAQMRLTMLDVGQGQCILLENGGRTVAVDCGKDDESGEALARLLLTRGEMTLDVLILTHFDTDHVGGAVQLFSRVEVGAIFAPDIGDDSGKREELLTSAAAYDIPVYLLTADASLELRDGTISLFAPVGSATDNNGLAALLSVCDCDILITGDMDANAERRLLASHTLPDLEVLVAGHHGSKYSTCEALLEATTPEVVLISVGSNSYGHPTQLVLDRAAAAGALIYRTDLDGDITVMR